MSKVSASVNASGSRFAEPPSRNTGLPSGIVTPCRSHFDCIERRTLYCFGRLVAQQLLHRGGDLATVVEQLLPLVGIARERHRRIAHQLGDGLGTRTAQKRCETGDLEVVEGLLLTVFPLDLSSDQPAEHVVTGFRPDAAE